MISAVSHLSTLWRAFRAPHWQAVAVGFTMTVYIMNKVFLSRINDLFCVF